MPLKIQYRYRPREYGDQLVRMYLLTNDKESKLGTTPLPDGIVRVFRNNGRDGLSYLTQQNVKYIPIGDKIELNLGVDPEVVFNLTKLRASRDHVWMQINGKNVFNEVGDDAADTEAKYDRRRLGRPQHLPPADSQLHGQADRRRNPPQLRRPQSSSAANWSRRNSISRPRSSQHRLRPAQRRTCSTRSSSIKAATPSRTIVTLETAEVKPVRWQRIRANTTVRLNLPARFNYTSAMLISSSFAEVAALER